MRIYHVSGHLDLTEEEFFEHYIPSLNEALWEGCSFVVGDARGADSMAQEYLFGKTEKVIVFHMFGKPRNNVGFPTTGNFKSDRERDKAMTRASTHDIAWVRPGREKSGTAQNLRRRRE